MGEPHVVIMGPMGVGKSTLGERLGRALDRPFRDSDADIERLVGRRGREIAATAGVDALHQFEAAVLLGALADRTPSVIGAAGWVVEDPRCRLALGRRAAVVVLDLSAAALIERLAGARSAPDDPDGDHGQDHRRHITAAEIEALAVRRRPLYREVADLWVDASLGADDVSTEVLAWLSAR